MAAAPSRVVFFGTPEFAVPTLRALCEADREPMLVVSQPARPVGRGRKLQDPPVAQLAKELGIAVVQPEKAKTRRFREYVEALRPDVCVVVAYGEILTRQLLQVPRLGCVNVHASLLPKYRGAAPIQAALLAGDEVSGVTTMLMEPGLDTGPMLSRREIVIDRYESAPSLSMRLAKVGAELLIETLAELERGKLAPEAQDDAIASYAPKVSKSDGLVDWSIDAQTLFNRLRAYTPWPGMTAEMAGERVKLLWFMADEGDGESVPGSLLKLEGPNAWFSAGSSSAIVVSQAQRPGRSPVSGAELARSLKLV